MNDIENMFLITLFMTLVIDIAKATDSLKYGIWLFLGRKGSWETIRLKPFDCSLCSSFWSSTIYLLWVGHFSILNWTMALLFACFTPIIAEAFWTVRDLMGKIISLLNKIKI